MAAFKPIGFLRSHFSKCRLALAAPALLVANPAQADIAPSPFATRGMSADDLSRVRQVAQGRDVILINRFDVHPGGEMTPVNLRDYLRSHPLAQGAKISKHDMIDMVIHVENSSPAALKIKKRDGSLLCLVSAGEPAPDGANFITLISNVPRSLLEVTTGTGAQWHHLVLLHEAAHCAQPPRTGGIFDIEGKLRHETEADQQAIDALAPLPEYGPILHSLRHARAIADMHLGNADHWTSAGLFLPGEPRSAVDPAALLEQVQMARMAAGRYAAALAPERRLEQMTALSEALNLQQAITETGLISAHPILQRGDEMKAYMMHHGLEAFKAQYAQTFPAFVRDVENRTAEILRSRTRDKATYALFMRGAQAALRSGDLADKPFAQHFLKHYIGAVTSLMPSLAASPTVISTTAPKAAAR